MLYIGQKPVVLYYLKIFEDFSTGEDVHTLLENSDNDMALNLIAI